VAKLLGIVANEVPTRKLQAANLSQDFFSIDRLKVFFLVLSEGALNITCPSITVTAVFPRRTLLLLVTVEHVTVNEGGKAIIGNVTHRGGGDTQKI
jgi:hypothetical protein